MQCNKGFAAGIHLHIHWAVHHCIFADFRAVLQAQVMCSGNFCVMAKLHIYIYFFFKLELIMQSHALPIMEKDVPEGIKQYMLERGFC